MILALTFGFEGQPLHELRVQTENSAGSSGKRTSGQPWRIAPGDHETDREQDQGVEDLGEACADRAREWAGADV
jgi:hypothetical protein